ncbi:MAG TPA: CapA family protein [Clostridia bacterium]|nr:CapA family protein [Clostridia bacterium]
MKVILCGDALFSSRNLANRIDRRVVDALLSADAVFTNAEFSTPKPTTPPGLCMYLTSVKPETLDEFVDLNIKLISFANNHTTDYGWQGTMDTIEASEARKLIYCGIGRNLGDARKARFLDTDKGRVSVVAACSTWAERSLASMPGADVVARPGLCPLRWGHAYVLPDKEFDQLKQINRMLGTEASMLEVSRVETWPLPGPDNFKFGSAMDGNLPIERGEYAHVRTYVHEEDEQAILKSIRDAAKRSDVVLASLHTHEGLDENWYAVEPPTFVEEFARKAIDAGATVVVGHGAHYARGVEIYNGRPIFYNLGSLIMEFEAGESMISPEMYHTYGWSADSRPSDLHGGRAKNSDGTWNGFYAERRFSKNLMVVMETENGRTNYKLLPLDLDMQRENCLERGLPVLATPEVGEEITRDLTEMSKKYGTHFVYNKDDGSISIQ